MQKLIVFSILELASTEQKGENVLTYFFLTNTQAVGTSWYSTALVKGVKESLQTYGYFK